MEDPKQNNPFPPLTISNLEEGQGTLMDLEPGLRKAVADVIGAIRQDMLPNQVQQEIFEAMSPTVQRDMVAKISGLEASVLMTFKSQIQLVDSVLRRIVNPDGTLRREADDFGIPLKDAMNLSLRITQVMTRDLPKIYTIDRIQKQEEALRRVMERCMTRQQQEEVLAELERIEAEGA